MKYHDLEKLDTIQWQHLGNGNFNNINVYKSLRTNRPRFFAPADYYNEEIIVKILSDNLKKGSYRLKYRVKTESKNADYKTYLKGCVKKDLQNISCYEFGYIKKRSWGNYSGYFNLLKECNEVNLIVKPTGHGKFYLDNITLLKKNGKNWKQISTVNWSQENSTLNNVTNLKPASNQYYSINITNPDSSSKKNVLQISSTTKYKTDSLLFKPKLKFGDFSEVKIGNNLTASIPLVLLGDKNHTFPLTDRILLNDLKKSISQEEHIKRIDFQLGNTINLWNSIQHFYPYLNELEIDWEGILKNSIKKCFLDSTDYMHKLTLESMLTRLKDSHVSVQMNNDQMKYYPSFSVGWIENKTIVTNTGESNGTISSGDQILEIKNMPIDSLLRIETEYVSTGNRINLYERALRRILRVEKGEKVNVLFKNSKGKILRENSSGVLNESQFNKLSNVFFCNKTDRQLEGNIYYINLNKLDFKKFNELIPGIQKAQSLIIDLRGYPTMPGAEMRKVLGHFISETDSLKWMFIPQISRPDRLDFDNNLKEIGWNVKSKYPRFNSRIYFLINHNTQSYAESITGYFEKFENVTMVGSNTSGANGSIVTINLNENFYFGVTGMKVLKHDGSRLHGIGFLPDVEVRPTIQGIIEGRDEVLEKAIELASSSAKASKDKKSGKKTKQKK